jgi:hypothetical protein
MMRVQRIGEWGTWREGGWFLEAIDAPRRAPRYFAVDRTWLSLWPWPVWEQLAHGAVQDLACEAEALFPDLDAIPLPPAKG